MLSTLSCPWAGPAPGGLNSTSTVPEAPGAMAWPETGSQVKTACCTGGAIAMTRSACPVLVMVTVRLATSLTVTLSKEMWVGLIWIAGRVWEVQKVPI